MLFEKMVVRRTLGQETSQLTLFP